MGFNIRRGCDDLKPYKASAFREDKKALKICRTV